MHKISFFLTNLGDTIFFITFLISGCGNINKTIKGETRSAERERGKKSTKYRDGGKYYLHLQRCVTGFEIKKKKT